jgi:hypothetical protein
MTMREHLLSFQHQLLESVLLSYEEVLRGRNSQGRYSVAVTRRVSS